MGESESGWPSKESNEIIMQIVGNFSSVEIQGGEYEKERDK